MIVVNKPKGLVVHPAAGHWSGTLVNALMYHCRDSLSGIGGELRPGIVHRIDKDTSGLLIAAKTIMRTGRWLRSSRITRWRGRMPASSAAISVRTAARSTRPSGATRRTGKRCASRKGRPRGRDALARAGALSGLYAAGMQTRNGPHTPDPRASGMAEPSDPRGHGLRTQEAGAWDGHAVPPCAGADVPASAHRRKESRCSASCRNIFRSCFRSCAKRHKIQPLARASGCTFIPVCPGQCPRTRSGRAFEKRASEWTYSDMRPARRQSAARRSSFAGRSSG